MREIRPEQIYLSLLTESWNVPSSVYEIWINAQAAKAV
jgi:hypothetical protein